MKEQTLKRVLAAALLVLLAVVSFLPLADRATEIGSYERTIASIDDKVETVLKLTAASTLASAGVSAIPGDTATPISEKLADFTEYFLLILCVLYAEKYLLTIVGAAAFRILIPLACLLLAASLFWNRQLMRKLAGKMTVFALAVFLTVPLSVRVSDMIYQVYQSSLGTTIEEAEQFTQETTGLSEAAEDEGLLASVLDRLSESVTGLANKAARVLNRFIEALAVMIVTSCVIPILVLLFFLWLIKLLLGIEITVPLPHRRERRQPAPEQQPPEGKGPQPEVKLPG